MATTTAPRCGGIIDHCGRRYRCTRPAARKHGYKFCGFCAPKPPKCGATAGSRFFYHHPNCAGCGLGCCQDRSKCVAGRCHVFVLDETGRKTGETEPATA